MTAERTILREDLLQLMCVLVDQHYSSRPQAIGSASLYAEDLLGELADAVLSHLDAWGKARDTGAGTLADCVLMMLPQLHRALCSRRGRRDCCEQDVRFCASVVVVLARWLIDVPMVQPPLSLIADVVQIGDPAMRRDRLEVAFRDVLAPTHSFRRPPTIEAGAFNVQINASVSRPGNDAYFERRSTAKHIEQALTVDGFAVEVTSDWAHPAARERAPLDEAVDGAIYRTTAMIVFSDDGSLGTGDTLRLAATLSMPTLVLRQPADTPLQSRRDGRLALRRERSYESSEAALIHVQEFLHTFSPQIAARHADLVGWSVRHKEILWISQAVDALDSALFETSRVTRAAARFFASDPAYWFQADPTIREEVERLVAPGRLASAKTLEARMGEPSMSDGADAALHRERISMTNLVTAAEIHGWSYIAVSRLLSEHVRREARQARATSHIVPPRQENDWARLYRELFAR